MAAKFEKPTVKQHLAAIRMLFDYLVVGQILAINPMRCAGRSTPSNAATVSDIANNSSKVRLLETQALNSALSDQLAHRRDNSLALVRLWDKHAASRQIAVRDPAVGRGQNNFDGRPATSVWTYEVFDLSTRQSASARSRLVATGRRS